MKICPSCQHPNPELARFCNHCGAKLEKTEHSPLKTATTARSAERRQLTILFCDLVGSTPLSEQLDPEEFRDVITQYHQVAEGVIQLFGGHVAQYLGDGLLVYFGYPKGLEDAPRAGVRAGLGILNAMKEANAKWQAQGRSPVKVRIGIHTGLVVVDEHLALGETVNVAARLEGLAPHNGLVISPQTKQLIEGWFNIRSIGKHMPKGISKPMELFQVLGETEAKTRLDIAKGKGLSPLVGRDKELDLLRKVWEKILQGKGQAVLINGEAGIGKSRIIDHTEQMVKNDPFGKLLKINGSAYHSNSAFYPLTSMLQQEFLTGSDDDLSNDKITRLEKLIRQTSLDTQLYLPLLAELLSINSEGVKPLAMSPFAKRQIIIDGLCQLLENLAKTEPMLLVFEDLHWLDASTREWLQMWINRPLNHSILSLISTRPSYTPGWKDQDTIIRIDLKRLGPEAIRDIVIHQTGNKALPDELIQQIEAKTEGVPLFVEELTKMITHSELVEEREDMFILKDAPDDLAIPSTLQDSLLARLDQLEDAKEVVLLGSVLGRSFSYNMLHAITSERSEVLDEALAQLVHSEIFNMLDDGHYEFKHALIQDAAYASLLKSDRQQKHLHVAGILERDFLSVVTDHPESLAYHYTEGNQPVTALPLWLKAGQKASQQNAMSEAIAHLQKGIALLDHIEDPIRRNELELDFRITLGGAYVVAFGFPHTKVKEAFDTARSIAQKSEVSPKLALILMNLLSYYMNTENLDAHLELSKYVSQLTGHQQHGYWFEMIYGQVGAPHIIQGDYQATKSRLEQVLDKFNPELPFPWAMAPSGYLEVGAKAWLMVCLQAMGFFRKARELADKHLQYADLHHDSMTLYHIHTFPALYSLEAREWKAAEKIIDDYFPIVRAFGDPVFILTAEVYHAIARGFQGDRDAFAKAVNLVNSCFDIGFKAFAVTVSSWIGELYYRMNQHEAAIQWNSRIIEHVNQTGSHVHTTELFRVKALAMQALGHDHREVETLLKRAKDLAIEQSSRTYELRAATDLARIWHRLGKAGEAKDLMKTELAWFPSDFSNIDLKNAMMTLEELTS